jgi:hypothetical protein
MKARVLLMAAAMSAQVLLPFPVLAAGVGQTCGGLIGALCDTGLFCEMPAGKCGVADGQGKCAKVPSFCNRMYKPVCGCDNKTYGNDRERQMAKASKAHNGKCG